MASSSEEEDLAFWHQPLQKVGYAKSTPNNRNTWPNNTTDDFGPLLPQQSDEMADQTDGAFDLETATMAAEKASEAIVHAQNGRTHEALSNTLVVSHAVNAILLKQQQDRISFLEAENGRLVGQMVAKDEKVESLERKLSRKSAVEEKLQNEVKELRLAPGQQRDVLTVIIHQAGYDTMCMSESPDNHLAAYLARFAEDTRQQMSSLRAYREGAGCSTTGVEVRDPKLYKITLKYNAPRPKNPIGTC